MLRTNMQKLVDFHDGAFEQQWRSSYIHYSSMWWKYDLRTWFILGYLNKTQMTSIFVSSNWANLLSSRTFFQAMNCASTVIVLGLGTRNSSGVTGVRTGTTIDIGMTWTQSYHRVGTTTMDWTMTRTMVSILVFGFIMQFFHTSSN